jgi:hypothetical protein
MTGKPKLFCFNNWLTGIILSSSCHLDKQKNNVENSTIKSLKWYSQLNSREKHLPKWLAAWKAGWTFYSVILFLF